MKWIHNWCKQANAGLFRRITTVLLPQGSLDRNLQHTCSFWSLWGSWFYSLYNKWNAVFSWTRIHSFVHWTQHNTVCFLIPHYIINKSRHLHTGNKTGILWGDPRWKKKQKNNRNHHRICNGFIGYNGNWIGFNGL